MYQGHAMPTGNSAPVKATVKWFNPSKGFGFVAPEDGQGDAFLHGSALADAGIQMLADGTEVLCEIGAGAKGRQVNRIFEVLGMNPDFVPEQRERRDDRGDRGGFGGRGGDRGGFAPRSPRPAPSGEEMSVVGNIKWFKADKGFGFIQAEDGGPDIFVHKSLLRTCNVSMLDAGMRVEARAVASQKGREATWIQVVD